MIGLRHFFIFTLLCVFLVQVHAEEHAPTDSHDVHHQQDQRQSHIDTLVEWFEEQQAYLTYLENMKGAVEKELSIISLMAACQQRGAECTGRGIVFGAVPAAGAPQSSQSADGNAADDHKSPAAATPKSAAAPNLPIVLAVYEDSALVEYQDRRLLVRSGDRLAGFRVRAIGLDQFELESASGVVRLPVYWPLTPPTANPDSDSGEAQF